MIYQGNARYPVTELAVHCSATRPTWMEGSRTSEKRAEIDRWHREDRGWRKIGYHYVIDRDGTVLPGRLETEIGAGIVNHNRGVIHVCLFGGHGSDAGDRFEDHFTAAQDKALVRLIRDIDKRAGLQRILGHNEYAATACPGFHVPSWAAARGLA